ncbi:MAG TPA: hypothetical protein VMC79_00140 [Rectinemataceae bacterium]|nr:hypothetical protein [Rectinemataceae bacterium]
MNRTVIVLVVALATAGALFAQQSVPAQGAQNQFPGPEYGRMMGGFGEPWAGPGGPQAGLQSASIEGKLVFIDDYPAVQTKDKTYIVRMPRFYYYAYTDNIREGTSMKLQGYVLPTFPGQDKPFFMVKSATIGSKTYDFSSGMPGPGGLQGRGQRGGMMGGWGPQGGW